jgi:hypothetical protein
VCWFFGTSALELVMALQVKQQRGQAIANTLVVVGIEPQHFAEMRRGL